VSSVGVTTCSRLVSNCQIKIPQLRHKNALLKSSCGCGEEHEIVGEDTPDEFAALRLMSSRGQR
jgi:hypothetical protein